MESTGVEMVLMLSNSNIINYTNVLLKIINVIGM